MKHAGVGLFQATCRRAGAFALVLSLASVPSLPAEEPGPAPPADELAALGWTPVAEPASTCVLEQPRLEARLAVWMSVNQPSYLPRPGWACGESRVVLPVAQDPALLERLESPTPMAAWAVRSTGHVRGSSAAVDLDFIPYRTERAPSAPGPGVNGMMTEEFGQPMLIPPRPVRDPSTRGRASKYNRVPEPPPELLQPELLVSLVGEEGAREDGLFATADGIKWVTLALPRERAAARFGLRPDRIFGGEGRLLVAPRALQVDAATALLAVDPGTGEVLSLGRPAPKDAGHWLRITDARERSGVIEALVCVDDISQAGISSPWGLLARRDGASWTFLQRYFTPHAKGVLPELRFDDSDPAKLWLHSGSARASRALVPQASAPAP